MNRSMIIASLRAILDAIESADLGGAVLWINPPYALDGVHETASERLQAMLQMLEQAEAAEAHQ